MKETCQELYLKHLVFQKLFYFLLFVYNVLFTDCLLVTGKDLTSKVKVFLKKKIRFNFILFIYFLVIFFKESKYFLFSLFSTMHMIPPLLLPSSFDYFLNPLNPLCVL